MSWRPGLGSESQAIHGYIVRHTHTPTRPALSHKMHVVPSTWKLENRNLSLGYTGRSCLQNVCKISKRPKKKVTRTEMPILFIHGPWGGDTFCGAEQGIWLSKPWSLQKLQRHGSMTWGPGDDNVGRDPISAPSFRTRKRRLAFTRGCWEMLVSRQRT